MRETVTAIVLYLCVFISVFTLTVKADDGTTAWKEEFERICAQTEIATSLTGEQLRKLISDSDELLLQLKGLEDPWAKVYILRLEKCREFFKYSIEWQEKDLPETPS